MASAHLMGPVPSAQIAHRPLTRHPSFCRFSGLGLGVAEAGPGSPELHMAFFGRLTPG